MCVHFYSRPYHALLLLDSEKALLAQLPLDCSPALVRLIKTCSAVKNLQQLAQDADLALLQVHTPLTASTGSERQNTCLYLHLHGMRWTNSFSFKKRKYRWDTIQSTCSKLRRIVESKHSDKAATGRIRANVIKRFTILKNWQVVLHYFFWFVKL